MKSVVCLLSAVQVFAQHSACVSVQHGIGSQAGDGVTFPKVGDSVTMHYVGSLTTGQKFDSSRDRGKPFTTQIGVGQVIQGWDQGVPQLSLGESATLRISSACGYGFAGSPPDIPANADLVFQVELLGINGKTATSLGVSAAGNLGTTMQQRTLPTCKPADCGLGLTDSGSMNAVCLCDASCLSAGSVLPCCQSFKETCQPTSVPSLTSSFPSFSSPFSASFSTSFPSASFSSTLLSSSTTFPPAASLPECTPSQCGKAISFNAGSGRPLCLCNPMCDMMKGTPGVLPCCPKIQEVCLDPWRSPSAQPLASAPTPFFFPSAVAPASFSAFGTSLPAFTVPAPTPIYSQGLGFNTQGARLGVQQNVRLGV